MIMSQKPSKTKFGSHQAKLIGTALRRVGDNIQEEYQRSNNDLMRLVIQGFNWFLRWTFQI